MQSGVSNDIKNFTCIVYPCVYCICVCIYIYIYMSLYYFTIWYILLRCNQPMFGHSPKNPFRRRAATQKTLWPSTDELVPLLRNSSSYPFTSVKQFGRVSPCFSGCHETTLSSTRLIEETCLPKNSEIVLNFDIREDVELVDDGWEAFSAIFGALSKAHYPPNASMLGAPCGAEKKVLPCFYRALHGVLPAIFQKDRMTGIWDSAPSLMKPLWFIGCMDAGGFSLRGVSHIFEQKILTSFHFSQLFQEKSHARFQGMSCSTDRTLVLWDLQDFVSTCF